jgi:hypothetical protein
MGHEDSHRWTGYDPVNIQQAKDGIKDALRSYLDKDTAGNYLIPRERQRPILLIGAPGIGKTAIMSQIAAEMDIGYIGYTITHHTRQSAIGLPFIEKKRYGEKEFSITEYTLSEIIASVYDAIETQDRKEGILFIDEINCVSETLSPAMLDLLQNKKFGPHRIPEGWILVAAGNPVEYNASVREFDIATIDRVRMIEVSSDPEVWLRYAYNNGVHDAILYYIQIKPQNLLSVERTVDGPKFVTPRSWEDLSVVLRQHEKLGFPVGVDLISQYIHDPDIASEFHRYMLFHTKYKQDYDVLRIMEGDFEDKVDIMKASSMDEKLAVISVFVGELNSESEADAAICYLGSHLEGFDHDMDDCKAREMIQTIRYDMRKRLEGNITADERKSISYALSRLESLPKEVTAYSVMELSRNVDNEGRKSADGIMRHFDNMFSFMTSCFGNGQETASFLVDLIDCYHFVMFAVSNDFGSFYDRNDELLVNRDSIGTVGITKEPGGM